MAHNTKFFKCRVSKVEERFERRYREGSLADARTESQVEYEEVSIGWFVSLEGWGVAMKWSDHKPGDIAAGDQMIIGMWRGTS